MIEHKPFPLKKVTLWLILSLGALATAYIAFVSFVSVWVGISHMGEDGWWVPILGGALSATAISWLYYHAARIVRAQSREKDLLKSG
jgi:hypothetical protein